MKICKFTFLHWCLLIFLSVVCGVVTSEIRERNFEKQREIKHQPILTIGNGDIFISEGILYLSEGIPSNPKEDGWGESDLIIRGDEESSGNWKLVVKALGVRNDNYCFSEPYTITINNPDKINIIGNATFDTNECFIGWTPTEKERKEIRNSFQAATISKF